MNETIRAEIISIGYELLTGMTVNTNAAYIGEKLTELGYEVCWISTVGDDDTEIMHALKQACDRACLVVLTGGLGPTHDDITKEVVSRFFESKIIFHPDVLAQIRKRFRMWGRTVSETNRQQAMVPEKAEILENTVGTAPGFLFEKESRLFFVLPGIPTEMREMMEISVIPRLLKRKKEIVLRSKLLPTTGISESELYDRVRDFLVHFPNVKLAFLPQATGVVMRLTVKAASAVQCDEMLEKGAAFLKKKAGRFIFGEGNTSLEKVVADLLFKNKCTVSVAESCTGGLVSHKLTNVPGSSHYFNRGIVAYSNQAKMDILGVPENVIRDFGAVSSESAVAMAEGVRRISRTDIGLSVTGIAGPSGGTPEKPVGLVFIGYSDKARSFSERHQFSQERLWNKKRSSAAALDLLRRVLLGYV